MELGKFVSLSLRIWQTGPQNSEEFATEKNVVPSYKLHSGFWGKTPADIDFSRGDQVEMGHF